MTSEDRVEKGGIPPEVLEARDSLIRQVMPSVDGSESTVTPPSESSVTPAEILGQDLIFVRGSLSERAREMLDILARFEDRLKARLDAAEQRMRELQEKGILPKE